MPPLECAWSWRVFRPFRKPVLQGGDPFRVLTAAGKKADAVVRHGVLIGRLIAQIHAPAHMVAVVGSR